MVDRDPDSLEDRRLKWRMGTKLDDGVSVAARLEGLAEAGYICISRTRPDLPIPLWPTGPGAGKCDCQPIDSGRQTCGYDLEMLPLLSRPRENEPRRSFRGRDEHSARSSCLSELLREAQIFGFSFSRELSLSEYIWRIRS